MLSVSALEQRSCTIGWVSYGIAHASGTLIRATPGVSITEDATAPRRNVDFRKKCMLQETLETTCGRSKVHGGNGGTVLEHAGVTKDVGTKNDGRSGGDAASD